MSTLYYCDLAQTRVNRPFFPEASSKGQTQASLGNTNALLLGTSCLPLFSRLDVSWCGEVAHPLLALSDTRVCAPMTPLRQGSIQYYGSSVQIKQLISYDLTNTRFPNQWMFEVLSKLVLQSKLRLAQPSCVSS